MIFTKRRFYQFGIVLLAGLVILAIYTVFRNSLRSTSFLTGWMLVFTILFLAFYNLRKRLPFLPLGSSAFWLNLHLYGGWSALFLFILHMYPRGPQSLFGVILGGLFLLVALSGVLGIFISRNFASRLAIRGGEVIYERIPVLRKELIDRTEKLVFQVTQEANAQTIAHFYTEKLLPFLSGPKNFLWHLVESGAPWAKLEAEMTGLERLLNAREQEMLTEIKSLIRTKNDLDYHFALQSVLKYWLFVHIPATFAMLLVIVVHILLVYAFLG